MSDFENIRTALITGDSNKVTQLVQDSLNSGAKADEILNEALIKAMDIVGDKMQIGEMYIPEVLLCGKVMSAAVNILKPHLGDESIGAKGKIVLGTVKGDLHDIGKNLVKLMLESAGFEVNDLGVDVAPETFVKAVKGSEASIVALSALLTTTMPMMKDTVDAFTESGLRDSVKVLVGGAPITKKFADEIGADGYAEDAASATKMAKSLMQQNE